MSKSQGETVTAARHHEILTRRCFLLVIFALLDALYLTYHTVLVRGGYLIGPSACNLGGALNCDTVAESPFALLLGSPVAVYGVAYYLFWLAILALGRNLPATRYASTLFFLSLLSLPLTFYLALASGSIGAVCLFCVLLYLINILLTVVTWRALDSGLLPSIAEGARSILQLLNPQVSGARSAFLWATLAAGVALIVFSERLLIEQYFEPRRRLLADRAYLEPNLRKREASPALDLPISTDADLSRRDFSLGPADAKLTLVEFSDFQCPYCKRAADYLKPLVEKFSGDLRVVFKNFPLDSACNPLIEGDMHQFACQAALMARCAGAQGEDNFWKMHDALFALDGFEWSIERLFELSEEVGLDAASFDQCLSDPRTAERLAEDVALGNSISVRGTPTIFVNGKQLFFDNLGQVEGLLRAILNDLR